MGGDAGRRQRQVGEVRPDLAHDTVGGEVKLLAVERLGAVGYVVVGQRQHVDFGFFQVFVRVEELEHGVAEAARLGTFLNGQDAGEIAADARKQRLVYGLGEAGVDHGSFDAFLGQLIGGGERGADRVAVGDYGK